MKIKNLTVASFGGGRKEYLPVIPFYFLKANWADLSEYWSNNGYLQFIIIYRTLFIFNRDIQARKYYILICSLNKLTYVDVFDGTQKWHLKNFPISNIWTNFFCFKNKIQSFKNFALVFITKTKPGSNIHNKTSTKLEQKKKFIKINRLDPKVLIF